MVFRIVYDQTKLIFNNDNEMIDNNKSFNKTSAKSQYIGH